MIYFLIFVICFGASIVGAVCGIGGGVIIKPLLDAFGIMDVGTISFLSGCTVLSMTCYSVVKGRKNSQVQLKTGLPLALGAALGGVAGKWCFSLIQSVSTDKEKVGAVQAICLLVVTVGTLLYTLFKNRIRTYQITSAAVSVVIGLLLGILSSFLGIGGGPINLVVFYFFFSMSTKNAAENSLYVIFFSQTASLLLSILTGKVPEFLPVILMIMVFGGIAGGICGRTVNKKINDRHVEKLFIGLMAVMILINIYNIYRFW